MNQYSFLFVLLARDLKEVTNSKLNVSYEDTLLYVI